MKKLGLLLLLVCAVAGTALAQNVGDNSVYFTSYFSNANTSGAPDATVRVVNDGYNGTLYAAYYVFDDSQEMSECGACQITADGINSESVNKNLTANPLTGRFLHVGVIKLISTATGDPTATTPRPGLRPWATHAHYCSSKAAVHMLTKVMAKALAPEIAVNAVAPGMIELGEKSAAAFMKRMARQTPMRRNGTAADIAAVVMFFATAPSFITGQVLAVDGGIGL